MLTELVNSIKATLYDRTSSPLFGSFVVSWLACNHKLLIVLVGEGKAVDKLALVDGFYPTWQAFAWTGVLLPVLLAAGYIFLYPIPASYVYRYATMQQKKLRDIKKSIEGSELLTVEESQELREKHAALRIEFDRQLKSLQAERDAVVSSAGTEKGELLRQVAALTQERNTLTERVTQIEAARKQPPQATIDLSEPNDAKLRARRLANTGMFRGQDLVGTMWRLTFNPDRRSRQIGSTDGSKLVHLLEGGVIGEGKNENEFTWRWNDSKKLLEFVQADGEPHSRFAFDTATGKWESQSGSDLGMKTPRQFMTAED